MFQKLKSHWRVNNRDLFLIFCTFAIAGSSTGWLSNEITHWLSVQRFSLAWWVLKLLCIVIGYQLFILFFGFCSGQFRFFWNYEKRILARVGLIRYPDKAPYRLAIFASGTGTNARNIIEYFHSPDYRGIPIRVMLIVSNKQNAGVLEIAEKHKINSLVITKDRFLSGDAYLPELKNIDFIVLAGFLWKIPLLLINAFNRKIINIHPALLPKFGGKGMYGMFVHEEVVRNNESETGITIHYINENYDEGDTILQVRCILQPGETPVMIAGKVHDLEHYYLPRTIESLLNVKSELKQIDKAVEKS